MQKNMVDIEERYIILYVEKIELEKKCKEFENTILIVVFDKDEFGYEYVQKLFVV